MGHIPTVRRKLTSQQRQKIYEKFDKHCAYCGCELKFDEMQADHLIPMQFYEEYKANGIDIDSINNLVPACRSCNHYKSSLTLERFRNAIECFTKVLERDSVTYKNAVRFGQILPTPHHVVFYFEKYNGDNLK